MIVKIGCSSHWYLAIVCHPKRMLKKIQLAEIESVSDVIVLEDASTISDLNVDEKYIL